MTYAEAIRLALQDALQQWPEAILIGEGVPDPKAIFATTEGLQQRFGEHRVMDMPIAENGMTGICIGSALGGMRPIMVHQRIDFVLLALDQIINNAAKWHYMFNGQQQVPLVIRLIIGRGWGQGPQHSQGLQKLMAMIPGLKVWMPASVHEAYHMMMLAVADNNPVLYIEHRWLHPVKGVIHEQPGELENAAVVREGEDVTLVCFSYMLVEACKAADFLQTQAIQAEVVCIRSLTPLDFRSVKKSVSKTGRLLIADNACQQASMGHELISKLTQDDPGLFQSPPQLVAWPDHPVPTSPHLANHYYPDAKQIAAKIFSQLGMVPPAEQLEQFFIRNSPADVPDLSYTGPF